MQTKSDKLPLIILATYWNESRFVRPSLAQIEALNPSEIIICDGCFDPKIPNYSTDGTREIIREFVGKHPHARLISALRSGFWQSAWLLLRGHKHLSWWTMFRIARWKFLLASCFRVSYRRNQAITFNHMISLSKEWRPGLWFMTYDADHFYGNDTILNIQEIVNNTKDNFDLVTGKELAFFDTFSRYTTMHDQRGFANMPHLIYPDTLIQPTRSIIRETKSEGKFFNVRDILAKHLYTRFAKKIYAGIYFHYKLNSPERNDLGYMLGDRKKPLIEKYTLKEFIGEHPHIIKEYFKL